MDELYPDAAKAVELCRKWTNNVITQSQLLQKCKFYLFGSTIYESGEQFNALLSDLDIVCLLDADISAIGRLTLLKELKERKHELELQMIPYLQRESCIEPGVSIVVVTPFEVSSNIHKSGARSFFDANVFLDLQTEKMQISLPFAGERDVHDAQRQALEFCQKTRNEFLSLAANGKGGIKEFNGQTPLPKAMMRSAAQIAPMAQDGQWYDTRLGLEYLRGVLRRRSDEGTEFQALDKKVSVRCGGNGTRKPLTAEDQLLLAELMFDEAHKNGSVASVNWFMRVVGLDYSESAAKQLFELVRTIAPQVKYRGAEPGSIIIKFLSPVATYELFHKLFTLNVLGEVLGQQVAEVSLVPKDGGYPAADRHLTQLVESLQRWTPPPSADGLTAEESLYSHLSQQFNEIRGLADGNIERDVELAVQEVPYSLDFLLVWPKSGGGDTRIGVDVKVLRRRSAFYHKVSQAMQVSGPLVLVLIASQQILDSLSEDVSRLQNLKPNIHVLTFATR